jgi:hypothetical protein
MSVRKLARLLGLSAAQTSTLLRRGMPNDPEKAREWRILHVRPRARPERRVVNGICRDRRCDENSGVALTTAPAENPAVIIDDKSSQEPKLIDFFGADGLSDEGLEASLPRLRKLERSTASALERALASDNITAAVSLRREHVAVLRTLYNAEEKMLKIDEARGRLISVDKALGLISEALSAPLILLRRLPELGKDPEERKRLEAFLSAVLNEIKDGAQRGFNRSGPAKEAMS